MRLKEKCLPCIVDQVIKVADLTGAENREALYKKMFAYLGELDFDKTTPEIIGQTYRMVKKHVGCSDPYLSIRKYYNEMFLDKIEAFEVHIDESEAPFLMAVKYAILGNIIDFNPIHNTCIEDVVNLFEEIETQEMAIDHTQRLLKEIQNGGKLLYLGDNCGEICLDKILLKKIKAINPKIEIYFGVRGEPVVNDSISEDAYAVGIDEYATIISNGDCSLGTVLPRVSRKFREIYDQADIVIAKGQANYECLSEEDKNIYFLLFTKCEVIAKDIGTPTKKMIALSKREMGKVDH